jgi:hypothetical protein
MNTDYHFLHLSFLSLSPEGGVDPDIVAQQIHQATLLIPLRTAKLRLLLFRPGCTESSSVLSVLPGRSAFPSISSLAKGGPRRVTTGALWGGWQTVGALGKIRLE